MGASNQNALLVEGHEDLHAVIHLMRKHIAWPQPREYAPVEIIVKHSDEELLGSLGLYLKSRTITRLGVLLDADDKPVGRYDSFKNICKAEFPALSTNLPAEGIVQPNQDGKTVGLWMMPNNVETGGIESFLSRLVPDDAKSLWSFACKSTEASKRHGGDWKQCHADKANLATFLAWQDPPGVSAGISITKNILDPACAEALKFVSWFRKLYSL